MNILTDELPKYVEIDGEQYEINTDFRTAVRILIAFEDPELTGIEKQIVMLESLYPVVPENVKKATELGVVFLDGGRKESTEEEAGFSPRLYSFEKDSNLIFSAFKQTHGIDLSDIEYLHWWKFIALFLDLGADTAFCNLIALRKRVKTGTATKEDRKIASEMGDAFDIPEVDTRTLEEKEQEAEFMRLISSAGKENQ